MRSPKPTTRRPPGKAPQAPLIGVMLNQGCHHYDRILNGILAYVKDRKTLRLVRVDPSSSPEFDPFLINDLAGMIGDGAYSAWAQALQKRAKPLVLVTEKLSVANYAHIVPDAEKIGELAARYWLAKCPASFAFIGSSAAFSGRRREVFCKVIQEAGHEVHLIPDVITTPRPAPESFRAYQEEVWRQLDRLPKPCGLFAANDYCGTLVIRIAIANNIRVPEQLGVLGVDNDAQHSMRWGVPLSSIDLNSERLGRDAAEMLDQMLHHRKPPSTQLKLPPSGIVERDSSRTSGSLDPLMLEARNYLKANLGGVVSVDALARHCKVSRRLIERRFRQELDCSPAEELRNLRFSKARELLRETDLTLDMLVIQCGFVSVPSFLTSFKERFGETPTQYRKQHQIQGVRQ